MLNDRKLNDWTLPVISLADKPQMTAAALKAAFDSNSNEIKSALNGVVDDLISTAGAGEIGTHPIDGVAGVNVQAALAALKGLIDLRETTEAADSKLALKADKTTVAGMVQSIAFNATTGVFTITEQGGTVRTIDTVLEKVPMSCYLDGQDFVLVLADGTEQRASLASFLQPNEFDDSATVDFSVNGSHVTATIKSGSITLAMLESSLLTTLNGLLANAQTAATNAAASAGNASSSATAAAGSATTAGGHAVTAQNQAKTAESWARGGTSTRPGENTNNAMYYAGQAQSSAGTAAGHVTAASGHAANAANSADAAQTQANRALTEADRAKAEADRAGSIVGGDYVTRSEIGTPSGVAGLDSGGKVPSAQLPDIDAGGKRTSRFSVGTAAAGWAAADCDYLCTGENDQLQINAAIQALPAQGGEIVILDGTYSIGAEILIDKNNVKISGNGNATKLVRDYEDDRLDEDCVIRLAEVEECTVENLYIDGNSEVYSFGIYLQDSNNSTVTGNTCNNSRGIYLYNASNNRVTGNNCSNNDSYGINLYNASNNTVTGNTCNNNNDRGIYLYNASNNTVTGNTCNNNRSGIDLYNASNNNIVTGNTCNNGSGINLYYASNNNIVTGNTCNNGSGINLYYASNNNTVTGNTCNNNEDGICLYNASNNTVTGNTCNDNDYSCISLDDASNNTVTGNTCIRGTGQASDYASYQNTIYLGSSSEYNLIAMNNCMGKAVTDEGETNNVLEQTIQTLQNQVSVKTEIVIGSYAADDAETKEILLGFEPKAIIVSDGKGRFLYSDVNYVGGMAILGGETPALTITQNGFMVYYNATKKWFTNRADFSPFSYIAFK